MSFINNNEFNHRDYNLLIQQINGVVPPPTGNITPGPVTVSAIQASGQPVMCRIDSDRVLIVYSRAFTFDLAAVVVDVSSGTPVFGTPVVIDGGGSRVPMSVRFVPGSANQFIAFSRLTTTVRAIVIEVTGTVITAPYAIGVVTTATLNVTVGYGEMLSAVSGGVVIGGTFGGAPITACFAFTVAAGIVTFGAIAFSTMMTMGGGGSRPLLDSGQLIQFGRNTTASPAYVASVAWNIAGLVATPTTVYVPPVVADRIQINSTFGQGCTVDLGGGIVGFLYQDFATASVASVRGAWSGTAASYSNSDSNKNILPALPYPPPAASAIQGYGQFSGSGGLGVLSQNVGGTISLYTINIVGDVNMASAITQVATGASGFRSELVFNTTLDITFVYTVSAGAFLACGVATFS